MKATALAIIAVVLAIGLYQFRASNLATKRVRNAGIIIDRGFGIGTVQVSSRSNDTKGLSSAIIDKYDYDGPCSNNPKNPPKFERICTPPIHIHLQQDETFEVFEGQMGWYLDGKTGIAKKGETVFVPAGAKHTYWLEGEEDVSVLTTLYSNVSLPIGFADESFFENFYSNERDRNYKTNIIEKLYLLYANGMHIGDLPYWVNEVLSSVLHVVAPLLGFKKHYPEYTVNYDLIYHQRTG